MLHRAPSVLALLVVGAILNVAVMTKLLAVLWERRDVTRPTLAGCEYVPALLLGVAAFCTGLVFAAAVPAFEPGSGRPATAGSPPCSATSTAHLRVAAGLDPRHRAVPRGARGGREPAEAFGGLRTSPATAGALHLAEKKLDWYEVGVKVVEWLTRVVFRYFERLIDVVTDAIIAGGKAVSGPAALRGP